MSRYAICQNCNGPITANGPDRCMCRLPSLRPEYRQAPIPIYPVPAIPIQVDWTDAYLGFVDLWVGIDPCRHVEFKREDVRP